MQELQIFNNEEFGKVRTVVIDNEPWFIGKDIAESLKYNEPHKAVVKHVDEEDRTKYPIPTVSGTQDMWILNESGLYSLIFGSKLETAKKFKRWVTSEVLPALRKTGTYTVNTAHQYPLPASTFESVATLGRLIERVMKAEKACPHEIAMVLRPVFQQAGIDIGDTFIKIPAYDQITLSLDVQ